MTQEALPKRRGLLSSALSVQAGSRAPDPVQRQRRKVEAADARVRVHFSAAEHEGSRSMTKRKPVEVEKWHHEKTWTAAHRDRMTFGQRVADSVAAGMGS